MNSRNVSLDYHDARFWERVGGVRQGSGEKVRADSVLKNLSAKAQALVADWAGKPREFDAEGKGIKGSGGVVYALAMLEEVAGRVGKPELGVSKSVLLKFLEWWRVEETMEAAQARLEKVCGGALMDAEDATQVRLRAEMFLLKLGMARGCEKLISASLRAQDARMEREIREREMGFRKG